METLTFTTSEEFLKWAQRVVKNKDLHYARVPKPPQKWIYGDGHVAEFSHGKRGGTMLANLNYMRSTATGRLLNEKDALAVSDIDARGGVAITINWLEDEASRY